MRGLKCTGLGEQGFSAIQGVQQCHVSSQGILESICPSFQGCYTDSSSDTLGETSYGLA